MKNTLAKILKRRKASPEAQSPEKPKLEKRADEILKTLRSSGFRNL
jgi:hypothetical protein